MLVLGIESSCDETGVALYDTHSGLRAHALYSQIAMHREYGGVVPELASRDHIRRVIPLLEEVLGKAGATRADIDAIAYTKGPGLAGALLVGASVANALAFALGKPLVAVHHLEGHLLSPLLEADRPEFPFLALLVSGGHTQLMRVDAVGQYTLLGETLDDAAGEAFDKTAKLLGLGYPGGPAVSRLAEFGNPGVFDLPRPMLHSGNFDFSFAGLKTAVLTQVRKLNLTDSETCYQPRADLARVCRRYRRSAGQEDAARRARAWPQAHRRGRWGGRQPPVARGLERRGQKARLARLLPRPAVLHRQRRDDRLCRRDAVAG